MKAARILVVDDDDHVRDALVDELGSTYAVEAVASGKLAFDALATQQYDVVISDLKMADHDGIEVLEFAKDHQRDAVRVLLTGYLDERAQRALLSPDAPYKVGKPWHDEIEIVVRRGLEQREVARRLVASVTDALGMSRFDDELAATDSAVELSEAVVRRTLSVEGVTAAATVVLTDDGVQPVTGSLTPQGPAGSGEWKLDLPLDADGHLRLRARGDGESAQQLVRYMAHRAQRRCGVLDARVQMLQVRGRGNRMNQLLRQATIGALTSSLLHDLASTMQTLSVALDDISTYGSGVPELEGAVCEAGAAGEEAVRLFVEMRKFIRGGEIAHKLVKVERLVDRAVRLAGGYVRERAELRVGAYPDAVVKLNEPLFVQVLGNLLRNAANASPAGGAVDLRVTVQGGELVFAVSDDGPGVAAEIGEIMFEPFASGTPEGTGLGLAISAYIMELLGGRLSYRREPGRGACFRAVLPISRGATKTLSTAPAA